MVYIQQCTNTNGNIIVLLYLYTLLLYTNNDIMLILITQQPEFYTLTNFLCSYGQHTQRKHIPRGTCTILYTPYIHTSQGQRRDRHSPPPACTPPPGSAPPTPARPGTRPPERAGCPRRSKTGRLRERSHPGGPLSRGCARRGTHTCRSWAAQCKGQESG